MIHYKLSFMLPFTVISLLFLISWKVYGYAEIHYTFFRYSLLNRGYPEILVDTPWRIEPGEPIPIVCIVKDADRFPVRLKRITARFGTKHETIQEELLLSEENPLRISDHYWYRVYLIEPPDGQRDIGEGLRKTGECGEHPLPLTGKMEATVEIDFVGKGVKRTIVSDNLPGLNHAPFNIFASPYKLPTFDGWYCGDPHYHSDMTQDQMEFGAPVEVAAVMGKAMGLDWLIATDHSYDLDIAIGDFFQHDPKLPRWWKLREDAERVNSTNDSFVVIPAEEVSCGNCKSHNIHLLAFDTPQFIPGKGDGVKRGLNKRPDLSLRQCINRINTAGGFAYASHPEAGNGFMGTLMLNRDHWRDPDYAQGGYTGLQFWNGALGEEFRKAYKKWIKLLLEGRKLYVLAGNDAHGDFNRCRKVKYPNTRLADSYNHVFGKVRTYAKCDELSTAGVLDALRNGRTIVTNGPVAILQARNDAGHIVDVGSDIISRDFTLTIHARSSEEFGPIDRISLYRGDLVNKREKIERVFIPQKSETTHVLTHRITRKNRGYIRAEATSSAKGKRYRCLTNPIWFRPA